MTGSELPTRLLPAHRLAHLRNEVLPSVGDAPTLAVVGSVDQRGSQCVAVFSKPCGSVVWALQTAFPLVWTSADPTVPQLLWSR